MSKYQYPRVNPPSSKQQLGISGQGATGSEDENRPYSWFNAAREPEDGRFSSTSAIPPLPQIPDHLNLALQSQLAPSIPSSEPAPEYPIDEKIDTNPTTQQPYADAAAQANHPRYHRSTPSTMAPEVIKYEYHPPQQQTTILAPDANPLSPTTPTHPLSRTNTTNLPILPPSEPSPSCLPSHLSHPVHVPQGGTWRHAFCSCADTPTCLTGLFCPCVIYGKTQYRLTLRSEKKDPTNMLGYSAVNGSCAVFAVLCGCNWILAAIQHTRVRKTYGMGGEAGGVVGDCMKALCCCCCTLSQDEKEVKWREVEARTGGGEGVKSQYQAPLGMSYPGPPRRP